MWHQECARVVSSEQQQIWLAEIFSISETTLHLALCSVSFTAGSLVNSLRVNESWKGNPHISELIRSSACFDPTACWFLAARKGETERYVVCENWCGDRRHVCDDDFSNLNATSFARIFFFAFSRATLKHHLFVAVIAIFDRSRSDGK